MDPLVEATLAILLHRVAGCLVRSGWSITDTGTDPDVGSWLYLTNAAGTVQCDLSTHGGYRVEAYVRPLGVNHGDVVTYVPHTGVLYLPDDRLGYHDDSPREEGATEARWVQCAVTVTLNYRPQS